MDKYVIIDREFIEKRIQELEERAISMIPAIESTICYKKIDELKEILLYSTPLIPEIEKAVEKGIYIEKSTIYTENYINRIREYISTIKI